MASPATPNQISLRIMVNKQKNRVLFAEAGKEFVDIVLSFLTMPLGTIARLVNKDTNSKGVTFGCITSLYQSVHNLDPKYFNTKFCKQMLLQPRNPMEAHCRKLKLNIDDTQPTKYFVCADYSCQNLNIDVSTFMNQLCKCGRIMNKEIKCDASISVEGYVHEGATFIIFDDLIVKTWDQCTTKVLLHRILRSEDDAPQELAVNLSINEVVDLLKFSLLSNSPLTESFLLKKQYTHLDNTKPEPLSLIKKETAKDDKNKVELKVKVKVKVTQIRSESKILFAQVEEDFMDVLLSFLTLPLGAVERVLHGDSNLRCIDNLFNSVVELNAKYFKSEKLKDMIINPGIAPDFKVNNQILPIDEVKHSHCYCRCHTKKYDKDQNKTLIALSSVKAIGRSFNVTGANSLLCESSLPVTFMDPKAPLTKGETNKGHGFVNRVSMFMVTDELIVKPYSFISVVSFLNDSKVEDHDLEETIISIGLEEVTSILKASITSSSTALTDGLGPFMKCIKQEMAI